MNKRYEFQFQLVRLKYNIDKAESDAIDDVSIPTGSIKIPNFWAE